MEQIGELRIKLVVIHGRNNRFILTINFCVMMSREWKDETNILATNNMWFITDI